MNNLNSPSGSQQKLGIGKYYGASIMALFIWSTSLIATKIAYFSFSPLTLGVLRFVIAILVLGMVLVVRREFVRPSLKDFGTLAISGILGITLYFALQNVGVSLTSASDASLIVGSYPAITAALEFLVYKAKPSRGKAGGILISMAGVALLTYTGGGAAGRSQLIGNLLMIATGVVWAFYNFATQKVVNRYPAITVSFYQTAVGTIFFIPLALLEHAQWKAPTFLTLSTLIYLGVFCSVLAFLLYNYGLRKISSSTSVTLMNLVPVLGVIFSILFLHETVSLRQIAGGIVVIAGIFVSVRYSIGSRSASKQIDSSPSEMID